MKWGIKQIRSVQQEAWPNLEETETAWYWERSFVKELRGEEHKQEKLKRLEIVLTSDVLLFEQTAKAIYGYVSQHYTEVEEVVFLEAEKLLDAEPLWELCSHLNEAFPRQPVYTIEGRSVGIQDTYKALIEKYRIIVTINPSGEYELDRSCLRTKKHQHFCEAGFSILTVGADGSVFPCHSFSHKKEWKMGNIQDPFWEKSKVCSCIRNFLGKAQAEPGCRKCCEKETCVHCTAQLFTATKASNLCNCSPRRKTEDYDMFFRRQ